MSAAIADAGNIGRGTAATLKSGAENLLQFSLAALPLYPAVQINLDAAAGQGVTMVVVGVGFVIFTALAIHHSLRGLRDRQPITSLLWAVLGAGFLALNGMNAIGNLASHTDHSRDENRAKMQTAADISTQRHELTERRKVQFALAGEATPESIDAEIKAAKTANSALWRASESCDPNRITRDVTKAFCKSVADLEAKKAAATKRDEIDTKLAKLDEKAETRGEAPSTVDSFADAMAEGLTAFGYQINEKAKLAIVRARDWGKAIGVEVLAAFGPAALFGLFLRGSAPLPAPAEKPGRIASFVSNVIAVRKEAEARRHEAEARRAAEAEARAKAEAEEKAQAERAAKREARKMREKPKPETVETWLSTRVVDSPGNVLPATAAHDDYAADCRARGETPVSKRGPQFVAELRKLGLDVRERGSRKRAEIHGLALAPHAAGGGLRIVSSR